MTTRRIECACGCGRWFYWERAFHRPPKYATDDCRRRHRQQKRNALRRRARSVKEIETARAVLEQAGYRILAPGAA